tara:strand:- start:2167 stop:2751 length:585 start_codon:yes stop_codon:yes gene_type:complete
MNFLKGVKVNLIGARCGVNGHDWRESVSSELESFGSNILSSYVKPYIYTPREYPHTHEHLKKMKDTGYFQTLSYSSDICGKDHSWVAEHMRAVREHEIDNVKKCDIVICYLDPDIFTMGAIEELSYASLFKKPIFIIVPGGSANIPFWLLGMVPHKYILNSFKMLGKTIVDIDNGNISIKEDDYWGLNIQTLGL